jgi:hypothetical protein
MDRGKYRQYGSWFDNYADVVTERYYRPAVWGSFVQEERHL